MQCVYCGEDALRSRQVRCPMRTEDMLYATSLHAMFAVLGVAALGMVVVAVVYAMQKKDKQ